jgi:hypothetical protein
MKTQQEIKKLATKNYRSNGSGGGQYTEGLQEGRIIGFIDGYTQCQEDLSDKKYTEEDMQEYAEFCIMCYEGRLPCIIAKDWFEKFKNKRD